MKNKRIQITVDISEDCYNAMIYLRSLHINSKQLLRDGGEQYVINVAQKMKHKIKLVKLKDLYPSLYE